MDNYDAVDWENVDWEEFHKMFTHPSSSAPKKYTLKDVINEEFTINNRMQRFDDNPDIAEDDHRKSWYEQRSKQLTEMLKAFDVKEEMEILKKQCGTNYAFSERNKDFILWLFAQYNGYFEPLKRGRVFEADAEYLLDVYSGILDIFHDSKADETLVKNVKVKLWNRLNIPQISMDRMLDSLFARCRGMIKKSIATPYSGMRGTDLIYWQTALRHSFYKFLFYWKKVYDNMDDMRQDELSNISIEDANKVSEEVRIADIYEFMLSSQIIEARKNDEVLQSLMAQQDELRGAENKKKPLIRKVEGKYRDCTHQLTERMREVDIAVIRKYFPDFTPPEGWRECSEIEGRLKPSDQLLSEVIQDTEEQINDLFSVNTDEVKRQVEKYCL